MTIVDIFNSSDRHAGLSWERYLSRMGDSREWGDDVTLQAAAIIYNTNIQVFSSDSAGSTVYQPTLIRAFHHGNPNPPTVRVAHLGSKRYVPVYPAKQ